jgi:dipeptidyl aminopeptidase/acylaminoacyl peptidase
MISLLVAAPALSARLANDPYPLEYWALRSVISNAEVSPDGKRLAIMKIPNKDGNPVIEVYDAADLSKKPFVFAADPMEITGYYWVSNDDMVFTLRQMVRDKIEGFNQGVYENRIAVLDVKNKKFRQFDETDPWVEHVLPNEPNKIIISFQEGDPDGPGAKIDKAFRPRAYWEFDLERGTKKLLIRGKLSLGAIEFLGDGHPWLARGFDLAHGEYVWYWRERGSKKWEEIYRLSEDKFENFDILAIDDSKPNHVLVAADNGHDTTGLWSFNVKTGKFEEHIFQHASVDFGGLRYHSNDWEYPDTVTGIWYVKDKYHFQYFDDMEGATYGELEQLIPHSYYLQINSRSRDGGTMTIYNVGPRDPGSYYLLKNRQIKAVGSRQPLLESEKLADVKFIEYESRDGVTIPAYLTVPNGQGPWPLIVLPHGGPFVSEVVIYDEWAQMLANNGYMVVQPQYRGSFNYGWEFHKASFVNGGQGGHKMQDDKDDAALYLIEQGLADPDRVAMFGWSYGGYAALVAASRADQIYQCTIAGAAVADQGQQINYYRWLLRGAQKERQLAYRDDSVNPIDEVAKVNVPILLIHGDVDQRVPVTHSNRYRKELEEHGKRYKYVELEGADHFSNTLFYNHQLTLYESIIDFLQNDCGPGGL